MPSVKYLRVDGDVRPLPNDVLITNMEQGDYISTGGIIRLDDNGRGNGIRPRWCQVYKVGSNIDYIEPGQFILVPHGRWTYGIPVDLPDGRTFYLQKVDVKEIMVVSDEIPEILKDCPTLM